MEEQHDVSPPGGVYSFNSNAKFPFYKLSNFFASDVEFEGDTYPSSEHAFQAGLFPNEQRSILTKNGLFGSWSIEAFMHFGFNRERAEKKMKYWSKKDQIGIYAKMYANRAKNKKDIGRDKCELLFKGILMAKYTQNHQLAEILLSTRDAYLMEFDKGAQKLWENKQIKHRWAGMIVNGKVVGNNQMGALHMWTRSELEKMQKN